MCVRECARARCVRVRTLAGDCVRWRVYYSAVFRCEKGGRARACPIAALCVRDVRARRRSTRCVRGRPLGSRGRLCRRSRRHRFTPPSAPATYGRVERDVSPCTVSYGFFGADKRARDDDDEQSSDDGRVDRLAILGRGRRAASRSFIRQDGESVRW